MAGKKKKAAKRKRRAKKAKADKSTAPARASTAKVPKVQRKKAPVEEWEPIKREKRKFTYKLAEKYIDLPEIGVERAVSDRHVEFLAREMSQGHFLWDQASIDMVECGWDGGLRKLNGQHTCWARISLPESYEPTVQVNTWYVETENEWRELYSRFDRNWSRTAGHVIHVNMFDTAEFAGVSKSVLTKLASGYRMWRLLDDDFVDDPEVIANELRTPPMPPLARHVIRRIVAAASDKTTRVAFVRAPVIAAMLETFRRSVAKSEDFWDKSLEGVKFTSKNDPSKRLRDWLMAATLSDRGGSSIGARRQVSRRDMWNMAVTLYNDHKAGRDRKGPVKLGALKGWARAKR